MKKTFITGLVVFSAFSARADLEATVLCSNQIREAFDRHLAYSEGLLKPNQVQKLEELKIKSPDNYKKLNMDIGKLSGLQVALNLLLQKACAQRDLIMDQLK